jgi:gamma-glutamyltranspeptidase
MPMTGPLRRHRARRGGRLGRGRRLGRPAELGDRWPRRSRLAGGGVPVSAGLARAIRDRAGRHRADPGLSALLCPDTLGSARAGRIAHRGDRPQLAHFYKGHLGHRLADGLRRLGSPLTVADLAGHRPRSPSR